MPVIGELQASRIQTEETFVDVPEFMHPKTFIYQIKRMNRGVIWDFSY